MRWSGRASGCTCTSAPAGTTRREARRRAAALYRCWPGVFAGLHPAAGGTLSPRAGGGGPPAPRHPPPGHAVTTVGLDLATLPAGGPVMKAFVYEKYGPPETLWMAGGDTPAPGAGEVLVKVLAVSVNAADWHVLRGKPLFYRATLGLLRPKHKILGGDIAGQVEAVGGGVTQFQPGDQVYANLLEH